MKESEPARLRPPTALAVSASVAEKMRSLAAGDGRFGADVVARTARLAVEAWAAAVTGDDAALTVISQAASANELMYPIGQAWRLAPGPKVTKIEIVALEAAAEPPRLRLSFRFTGRRQRADRGQADGPDGEISLIGMLELILDTDRRRPWRLSRGHIETLDDFLGYVFVSRRETPDEYQLRTGWPAGEARPWPAGRYRVAAGFAEHDERFGSSVAIEVQRDAVPTRDEAVQLVWPAIAAATRAALGDGDWRPSLNWLDVVELLSGQRDT